ncbi:MAG: hypothetical protein ACJ759_14475 [Thermoanaerobaculia bacterium]
MHIAFLTLFLGLISAVQPFELSLSGPAASVEVLLDGVVVQRLDGPPWKGRIDFGSGLVPHELVARALDAAGQELARTHQWINLPRPAAEVEIALEGGSGAPRQVRLSWERLTHDPPVRTTLTLDGRELRLDKDGRASLPAYDPGSTHVLTAELHFPSNIVARKDLIFGGEAGETHTELTAVPVDLLRGRSLPDAAGLQGWFVKEDGTPLRVMAVEEGPAELYLVRVPDADTVKARLGVTLRRPSPLPLDKGDLLRIVSPRPNRYTGDKGITELFDLSPHFRGQDGLRPYLVGGAFQKEGNALRCADAAAVAGLHAMSAAHRRAVVLVLDASRDQSLWKPASVRRYLEMIRVPLFVWSVTGKPAPGKTWGETEVVYDTPSLERAFQKVYTELARQRIVWIEGRHLPQSIRLSSQAKGIALAAAERTK